MADIDPDDLKHQLSLLIAEEQGEMPVGLAIQRHLGELSAETAWETVSFMVRARSTLVEGPDGEVDPDLQKLLVEGILCGLRIRTAIATLRGA